ncbi:MAG TPA: hypothetical protein VF506_15750, partial [Streptosporangiaceae bacterium]
THHLAGRAATLIRIAPPGRSRLRAQARRTGRQLRQTPAKSLGLMDLHAVKTASAPVLAAGAAAAQTAASTSLRRYPGRSWPASSPVHGTPPAPSWLCTITASEP